MFSAPRDKRARNCFRALSGLYPPQVQTWSVDGWQGHTGGIRAGGPSRIDARDIIRFVSGHRFSDAASHSVSTAPLVAQSRHRAAGRFRGIEGACDVLANHGVLNRAEPVHARASDSDWGRGGDVLASVDYGDSEVITALAVRQVVGRQRVVDQARVDRKSTRLN